MKILDLPVPEPGAFYVMDRADLDFQRLCTLDRAGVVFRDAESLRERLKDLVEADGGIKPGIAARVAFAYTGQESRWAGRGSRVISVNGAAVHKASPGGQATIAAYAQLELAEVAGFEPILVYLSAGNRIERITRKIPA